MRQFLPVLLCLAAIVAFVAVGVAGVVTAAPVSAGSVPTVVASGL